ncbi:hypothetical protein BU17DRAFT_84636 [Hysterangium stoloniferum]|nr:hypothetical protein BU17DRAFT_84636 [Hysterangium stoloniferum]
MYADYTSYTTSSSRRDDRRFPGPLHIPAQPRFMASPSPSPYSSSASSGSPNSSYYRSPSPQSWSTKLPPIRHLAPSPRENLPHISSAKWAQDSLKPSPKYLDTPSSAYRPSHDRGYYDDSTPPRYATADSKERRQHAHDLDDGRSSLMPGAASQRRASISAQPPTTTTTTHDHDIQKSKFGVRKGSRFYCTYVSAATGERCAAWDQGWSVYATLNRHAESDHAPEELALIARGQLSYGQAQVVTSREKHERIQDNLSHTGRCPDCGTVFSSNRKDSLTRHKQTSACEKAQKRGRPPTKFPKKPKGQFHMVEMDSEDDYY